MKKLVFSAALLISASLSMISCNNGAYDANPNVDNSSVPVPATGVDFKWTGTDPISAKIDGAGFQATSGNYIAVNGSAFVQGSDASGNTISVNFPEGTAAGTVVSLNMSSMVSLTQNITDVYSSALGGGNGALKILENDATHVKGLFTATCKSASGGTKIIGEGYFNVNK